MGVPLACAGLLLGAGRGGAADPVRVKATASRSEVTLGEPFTLELSVSAPPGTRLTFPAELVTDVAELRSMAATNAAPGRSPPPWPLGTHRYEARVFAVGEATLPSLVVKYRLAEGREGEASAPTLSVRVLSLLPRDPKEQKLADIRPPVGVGIAPVFWLVFGALLVAGGLFGFWLWRRLKRPREAPAPAERPERSPADEAQAALERLDHAGLLARGDFRGFYIALSAIAKRYLERRLEAPVLEMTSAEMLSYLRDHAQGADLLPVMRELARAADAVKFARGRAQREEAECHRATVGGMLLALEQRLRVIEAAGAAAATEPTPAGAGRVA